MSGSTVFGKDPLLSVIIPVYNAQRYLNACIDSLINQQYRNLEFIFVNDGSYDNSLKIIEEAKHLDPRVSVINVKKKGASLARFVGLDAANGEYVTFLDSDDYIELDCYKRAMKDLLDNSADICEFNYECGGMAVGKWHTGTIEKKDIFSIYFEQGIHNKLWNKIYRREMFENVHFPEHRDIREDACIMPQVLMNCERMYKISDILYHYRIVSHSLIRKKDYTDWELAGSYRNDFDKINILWIKLPERQNEISKQFIKLYETIIVSHRNLDYFNLYNCITKFIRENRDKLILSFEKNSFEYDFVSMGYSYDDYVEIYHQYIKQCFLPKKFSIYRALRAIKCYIRSCVITTFRNEN